MLRFRWGAKLNNLSLLSNGVDRAVNTLPSNAMRSQTPEFDSMGLRSSSIRNELKDIACGDSFGEEQDYHKLKYSLDGVLKHILQRGDGKAESRIDEWV